MAVTRGLVRGRSRIARKSVEQLMAELGSREYPAHAPVPKRMQKEYHLVEDEVDGCTVLRLTPKAGATGQQLLYTHGGVYVHPLDQEQWWFLDRMTRESGVRLTLPLYRLAPESMVGAGVRAAAVPALQSVDPMLRADAFRACGALWADGRDPRDPTLSPLFADLDGLPPVHMFQGGHDILAADAQVLASRLQQSGNTGTFTVAPTAIHDYLAAFWTPEARGAISAVNQLLRE